MRHTWRWLVWYPVRIWRRPRTQRGLTQFRVLNTVVTLCAFALLFNAVWPVIVIHNAASGSVGAWVLAVAAAIGMALASGSVLIANTTWHDLHYTVGIEERLILQRLFSAACLRSLGKIGIAIDLDIVALTRIFHSVTVFLVRFPLFFAALLLLGLGFMTINEYAELWWRRLFIAYLKQRAQDKAQLRLVEEQQVRETAYDEREVVDP